MLTTVEPPSFVTYPGAVRPARHQWVDSYGVRIAVCEWGDAGAQPLFLVHGGSDFAGTFDVFAPLLAEAGLRVISWDHRGHGDSDHAALYSWDADVRDALSVLDAITPDPVPVLAHSKGGGDDAATGGIAPVADVEAGRDRWTASPEPAPDVSDHEKRRFSSKNLADWLDHRRRGGDFASRHDGRMASGETDEPRLSDAWLLYLASIGARKSRRLALEADPAIRFGGFGRGGPIGRSNV